MHDFTTWLTISVFAMTVIFLMWRPGGLNESVPPSIGAVVIILADIVPWSDLNRIFEIVSGASITILSTIVMSIVLESIGFFRWAALNIVYQAKGSGQRLFWYINLLCFLMTMFFNNDGSILITTPIIIQMMTILSFKPHQKIPYLLSGALVATASSAPIGVSNLANLIALKVVGLDLNSYAKLMFVPSMIGIGCFSLLLYLYFQKDIPKKIVVPRICTPFPLASAIPHAYYHPKTIERWIRRGIQPNPAFHPLMDDTGGQTSTDWGLFRVCIAIVILTRASFFVAEGIGVPIEWIAMAGALLLISIRWYKTGIGPADLLKKTPWHILIFAFSIYVIVYSLHNIGMTALLVNEFKGLVSASEFHAIMIVGVMLTVMSNVLNNLPSVMIGTISLMDMGLDPHNLQIAYLASIIGSDIGSLITPMGTLASLIWLFILRKNKIVITWKQYMKVTFFVIPAGLLISLISLYVWAEIIS